MNLVRPSRFPKDHRRRHRHDPAVLGLDQLPTAFMNLPVMAATEQDLVLDLTSATVEPVNEMMPVTP